MDPNLQPEVFRRILLKKYITEYYSQRDLRKHPLQSYHFTDKKKKKNEKRQSPLRRDSNEPNSTYRDKQSAQEGRPLDSQLSAFPCSQTAL